MIQLEKTAFLLITGGVALVCLWGIPPRLARSGTTFWSAVAALFTALVSWTISTQLGKKLVRFGNRRSKNFKRRVWPEPAGARLQQLAEAPSERGFGQGEDRCPDPKQARQIMAFLLLVIGILAYAIVFWWQQHPYVFLPGWVAALNQTIIVQALLAGLTGMLLAHVITFLQRGDSTNQTTGPATWSALTVRSIPLALLFALGFFFA